MICGFAGVLALSDGTVDPCILGPDLGSLNPRTISFMFSIDRFIRVVLICLTAIAFVFLSLGASAAPSAGVLDETHAAFKPS
jgi:hypothetical protein